jgi:hypothetical protein
MYGEKPLITAGRWGDTPSPASGIANGNARANPSSITNDRAIFIGRYLSFDETASSLHSSINPRPTPPLHF